MGCSRQDRIHRFSFRKTSNLQNFKQSQSLSNQVSPLHPLYGDIFIQRTKKILTRKRRNTHPITRSIRSSSQLHPSKRSLISAPKPQKQTPILKNPRLPWHVNLQRTIRATIHKIRILDFPKRFPIHFHGKKYRLRFLP